MYKKIGKVILIIFFVFVCIFSNVYAINIKESTEKEKSSLVDLKEKEIGGLGDLKEKETSSLLDLKEEETTQLEQYKKAYNSDFVGFLAYIVHRVRIFSIPCFYIIVPLFSIVAGIVLIVVIIKHNQKNKN